MYTPIARVATLPLTIVVQYALPVLQVHDSLECDPPENMVPLFDLLNSVTELAFLFGVGLAVFGFMFAGLCFIAPGEDWNRRGKQAAKNVFVGVLLLLSANMVVSFIVAELGGVVCG